MRARRTRESYIPAGSEQITDAESDAVIYVYEDEDARPSAVAFHGRAQKPDWHHWFRDKDARSNHIRTFFDKRRTHISEREARRQEEKAPHDFEVGDVLCSTWGYDQTNVDFYEVTRVVSDRTIELRAIRDQRKAGAYCDAGTATPAHGSFKGGAFRRRVTLGSVLITSFCVASRWDGKPVTWTAYA